MNSIANSYKNRLRFTRYQRTIYVGLSADSHTINWNTHPSADNQLIANLDVCILFYDGFAIHHNLGTMNL